MNSVTHPAISTKPERRVPGIDLLRGLCIVAVVLHHINLRIRFNQSGLGKLIGPAANRVLFWSGYNGVIVFFVISGFLITTWSLRRWGGLSQMGRRQFYLMRFARIMPCLLGLLAVLAVLHVTHVPNFVINPQRASLPRALLAALTFHVNWLESRVGYLPASWDVLWSLSIEEAFYIFFPLLCTLLRKQALLIGVLCCFLVMGPWARLHAQNEYWADNGYLSCMDGIALGCLAAIMASKLRLNKKATLALGSMGVVLCLFIDVFRSTAYRLGLYKIGLDITTLEFGTALLLIAVQLRFDQRANPEGVRPGASSAGTLVSRILRVAATPAACLRWFGRNSYEVYLTHMFAVWPLVILFGHFHQNINSAVWWFLAITALSGLLGWIVARFYSEPLNHRLRTQWLPRKAAAAGGD